MTLLEKSCKKCGSIEIRTMINLLWVGYILSCEIFLFTGIISVFKQKEVSIDNMKRGRPTLI